MKKGREQTKEGNGRRKKKKENRTEEEKNIQRKDKMKNRRIFKHKFKNNSHTSVCSMPLISGTFSIGIPVLENSQTNQRDWKENGFHLLILHINNLIQDINTYIQKQSGRGNLLHIPRYATMRLKIGDVLIKRQPFNG
jgi:hypothetical protein